MSSWESPGGTSTFVPSSECPDLVVTYTQSPWPVVEVVVLIVVVVVVIIDIVIPPKHYHEIRYDMKLRYLY